MISFTNSNTSDGMGGGGRCTASHRPARKQSPRPHFLATPIANSTLRRRLLKPKRLGYVYSGAVSVRITLI